MPHRDPFHAAVRTALTREGWSIAVEIGFDNPRGPHERRHGELSVV